ncbi:MAG: shikimate dehydrogenase [Synergistaceae bacterium]|jgi:shikimate dehydrogenase|nr:shikimate dehydrogenase [Synergistaceae bacterium]
MRHVVLIGLSGSGKTTLGRLAASELNMPFVDLDLAVEREMGMTIRRIFERHGEDFFRDEEERAVRAAMSSLEPSVVAAGGGAVTRPGSVRAIKERGFAVFLDRPVEHILRDVERDGSRPLLTSESRLREMARARGDMYVSTADAVLRNDGDLNRALGGLLALVRGAIPRLSGGEADLSGEPSLPEGCAVIGDPIAHTLSPLIHTAIFGALGVDAAYSALRVPRGALPEFAARARSSKLRGFNVTMPHKSGIIPLLDEVAPDAGACGAVNAVTIRGGKLRGFNTDMDGLLEALRAAGFGYGGKRVLILGAGGAARGAAYKAAREGASRVTILARGAERASETALLASSGEMTGDAMSREAARADILINATPLGMSGAGDDFPSLDFLERLPSGALVCDLVYNPSETKLLRAAKGLGLAAMNGRGMLIYQAILADELFFELRNVDRNRLYEVAEGRLTR